MSILDSLSATESGGNNSAYNNEVGHGGVRGHGGDLQFGYARLQDAAAAGLVPAGITPKQFSQMSGDEQDVVERWHKNDMMNQISQRGLSQYIGQNMNGTTITPDAIMAMAHLGGMGGASQYLKSGGQHNPSDSFGTSLSDYASKHGGASQNALAPAGPSGRQQQNALATSAETAMPSFQYNPNMLDASAFQRHMTQNALQSINATPYTVGR